MNMFFLWTLFDEDDWYLSYLKLTPQTKERLLLMAALSGVALIALLWAIVSRRSRRRAARRQDQRDRRRSLVKRTAQGVSELKEYVRQRTRRRKRAHRRNPTLAETGGLPPVRSGDASSSQRPLPPH